MTEGLKTLHELWSESGGKPILVDVKGWEFNPYLVVYRTSKGYLSHDSEEEIRSINQKANEKIFKLHKPEPRKEKIKQYRPALKLFNGEIETITFWSTRKPSIKDYYTTIVAIEEREIEIYPDGIEND